MPGETSGVRHGVSRGAQPTGGVERSRGAYPGAGVVIGSIFASMLQAVARQPELRGELQGIQWLGFALPEAVEALRGDPALQGAAEWGRFGRVSGLFRLDFPANCFTYSVPIRSGFGGVGRLTLTP